MQELELYNFTYRQYQIFKELNIPEFSLTDLLRLIKEDHYVIIKVKIGRHGYTRLWTIKSIVLNILNQRKEELLREKTVTVKYSDDSTHAKGPPMGQRR